MVLGEQERRGQIKEREALEEGTFKIDLEG